MTADYTEVLSFMSAAAKLKPVLRGFEQKSRFFNIVEGMRLAMNLGDFSWARDCHTAMIEYVYALGLDKYRRIITELEISWRTKSEMDYAASVYFAFIDMGSYFVGADEFAELVNLILQRRVKQYRSAQHWIGGVSEASVNIAEQHPGQHIGTTGVPP